MAYITEMGEGEEPLTIIPNNLFIYTKPQFQSSSLFIIYQILPLDYQEWNGTD